MRFISIRFKRRLAEVISVGDCAPPTSDHFHCDNAEQPHRVNQSVDDHLERLNATRFTTTSYVDEQRVRASDVLRQQVFATTHADLSPTVAADAVLVDFGFLWIVFLTLDLFLVTRRIGNMFRIKDVVSLLRVRTDIKRIMSVALPVGRRGIS